MENTTKINIPEGFRIARVDTASGEVTFMKKHDTPVTERILTVADVLADNGLTQQEFDWQCEGLQPDEVAYKTLKLLANSLNEGWTPNWDDEEEYKYYPWFEMGGSAGFRFYDFGYYWLSFSHVGSRLCFKSSELAEHAGRKFEHVYKQFMTI